MDTLDIDNIKQHAAMIGLEAELSQQILSMKAKITERKFGGALTHARNCVSLLDELANVKEEPCVLTSPSQSSKPSSTD